MTIPEPGASTDPVSPGASAEAVKLVDRLLAIRTGGEIDAVASDARATLTSLTAANARLAAEVEGLTRERDGYRDFYDKYQPFLNAAERRSETAETAAAGLREALIAPIDGGYECRLCHAVDFSGDARENFGHYNDCPIAALASAAPPDAANETIGSLCNKDGAPCYVMSGDDSHWRCGTSACGAKAAPPDARKDDGQ